MCFSLVHENTVACDLCVDPPHDHFPPHVLTSVVLGLEELDEFFVNVSYRYNVLDHVCHELGVINRDETIVKLTDECFRRVVFLGEFFQVTHFTGDTKLVCLLVKAQPFLCPFGFRSVEHSVSFDVGVLVWGWVDE